MGCTYTLRVRPRVRHVINSVVRVDTLEVATAPLRLLHMAAVQAGISRVDAVTVAVGPGPHEVRDVRQAAVTSLATIVRYRVVLVAVELNDGHVFAAWVAVDDDGVSVAVSIRGPLVVSTRDTSESGDTPGSHRIAGEDVGREAAAVALA